MLMKTNEKTCNILVELHRRRQDLHRAEKALTLRIKANCRRSVGGDKGEADVLYKAMTGKGDHDLAAEMLAVCAPFLESRALIEAQRKQTEKQMTEQAKTLPAAQWVESVRGFGMMGFASIVGEAGDLSNYANPAKLWKRLGLAVIKGERQQRKPGAEALEHGYSPERRSVIWTIGDSLFRANGDYSDLCRERKEYEREKAAEQGLTVCPAAKIPANGKENYRSDGHVHNRAKRYMEKRLIRDLWRIWE